MKKDVGIGPHKHMQVTVVVYSLCTVAEQQVEFGLSEEKCRALPTETA